MVTLWLRSMPQLVRGLTRISLRSHASSPTTCIAVVAAARSVMFGCERRRTVTTSRTTPPPFALERLCKRPAIGSRPDAGKHRNGWVNGKHSTHHCRQGHRFSYHFGSYHVPRPLQAHPCGAARQVFPPSTPSWHE